MTELLNQYNPAEKLLLGSVRWRRQINKSAASRLEFRGADGEERWQFREIGGKPALRIPLHEFVDRYHYHPQLSATFCADRLVVLPLVNRNENCACQRDNKANHNHNERCETASGILHLLVTQLTDKALAMAS
jgi:hypothetical protein